MSAAAHPLQSPAEDAPGAAGASGHPPPSTCVLGCLPFPRHDFRTVSTYLARMSQMAWDPYAIVFLVHVFKGVVHVAGHARDTFGTITGVPSRR